MISLAEFYLAWISLNDLRSHVMYSVDECFHSKSQHSYVHSYYEIIDKHIYSEFFTLYNAYDDYLGRCLNVICRETMDDVGVLFEKMRVRGIRIQKLRSKSNETPTQKREYAETSCSSIPALICNSLFVNFGHLCLDIIPIWPL